MTQRVAIVNASSVLSDQQVAATIPAFQTQLDRDFMPAWGGHGGVAMQLEFISFADFTRNGVPDEAWPFFLNRHSVDPGALGWHTDEGQKVYGRVFVGDCIRYGIEWTSDLSHELLETGADPDAERGFRMVDGRVASIEICDAVEADACGYHVGTVLLSNFVLPPYFGPKLAAGTFYDFNRRLSDPCPALLPGGYMEIDGGQITRDRTDGLLSRRVLMTGWRRAIRKRVGLPMKIGL